MGHYWVVYKQMKVTADELRHLSGSQTHELSVLMLPKRVLVFPLAVLEPRRLNRKIPTTGSQRGELQIQPLILGEKDERGITTKFHCPCLTSQICVIHRLRNASLTFNTNLSL